MAHVVSRTSRTPGSRAKPISFALERWFAEFEFVEGMRSLAASGAYAPAVAEVLALGGSESTDRYLALGLDYGENPGSAGLRNAVMRCYQTIGPGDVQITTGASEAILLVLWAFVQTGDNVVVEDPCYQSHDSLAAAMGAEVRRLPLRPEDGWKPNPERLATLIDGRTRLVFLNHPHNPTGSVLTGAEIADLIQVIERAGATLVSDEVFRPIALDGPPTPSAADLSDSAIAIGDMSKPWGLAGLRVGWCVSRQHRTLQQLAEVRDYTTMCCSAPAEFLAEMALRHSDALLAPRLTLARGNRELLAQAIARAGGRLSWVRPAGGYTAFVQIARHGSAEPLCRRMAVEEKVLLLPGSVFGERHAGWVRIGFGGREDDFRVGVDALEQALSDEGEHSSDG